MTELSAGYTWPSRSNLHSGTLALRAERQKLKMQVRPAGYH